MLPAGMNEDGVIEDMQAYDAWLADERRHSGICSGVRKSISTTATVTMSRMMSRLEGISDAQFPAKLNRRAVPVTTTQRKTITTSSGAWRSAGRVKGTELLGLEGKVDKQVFTELLQGKLPDGSDLTRIQDGVNKHRPGYDLTFSAPKSVSMLAMLGGDKRLIDAHNRAVTVALNQVESLASTRVKKDGVSETVLTGNLIIARFNHDTSRAQGSTDTHTQRGYQRDTERR